LLLNQPVIGITVVHIPAAAVFSIQFSNSHSCPFRAWAVRRKEGKMVLMVFAACRPGNTGIGPKSMIWISFKNTSGIGKVV